MTSPCAARVRSIFRAVLSSKKERRWKISGALSSRCAMRPRGWRKLVTGDTKVVDRGKADKIFINTSGIGIIPEGVDINPVRAQAGDKIFISGQIAPTASRSCLCAKVWNSKPKSRAIPPP